MGFGKGYYDGFEAKWRAPLESVAAESGIKETGIGPRGCGLHPGALDSGCELC